MPTHPADCHPCFRRNTLLEVKDWWAPGGCCTAYLQLVARLRGHVGKVVVQLCETAVLLLVMTRAASAAQQVCYPGIRLHRMAC